MFNSLSTPSLQEQPAIQLDNAGLVANRVAAAHLFEDYASRRSENTLRNQRACLSLFVDYLDVVQAAKLDACTLMTDPSAWRGVTWGLVEGFVKWQLKEGYSVASVNNRLSAVKVYAKLASKAGVISAENYVHIKAVSGYSQKEAKRVNERRETTRRGHKKVEHVSLTPDLVEQLKAQPNTPVGRRDAFILCLLLDHGLRVGEVAGLTAENFDIDRGEMAFYRPKVDKTQTHKLTADMARTLTAYIKEDAPVNGAILLGSRKGGRLQGTMSAHSISQRVRTLGQRLGIERLSAHDCRHYWATDAARNGSDTFALRDAGGWSSLAMPSRYVQAARIANQGIRLTAG